MQLIYERPAVMCELLFLLLYENRVTVQGHFCRVLTVT